MSGDNQHFIPQSTLRGFKISGSGKKGSVWYYQSGQSPRQRSIKRIASRDKFYSHPGSAVPDLDSKITLYENRLATLQQQLRDLSIGATADPTLAAEVVAHLTIRTDHIRQSFAMGAKFMASRAMTVFTEQKNVEKLVGLENGLPSGELRTKLALSLAADPRLKSAKLPQGAVERLVMLFMKERFPNGFLAEAPKFVQGAMAHILLSADHLVTDSHNKALGQPSTVNERTNRLERFQWSVESPVEEAILPDCVALAVTQSSEFKPLLLAESDEVDVIVMPLSPYKLLVGRKDADSRVDLVHFNLFAASCSQEFFVAASHTPELERWATVIGGGSWSALSRAVESAFDEYKVETLLPIEATPPPEPEPERFLTGEISYNVSFLGCAEEPIAQEIAATVKHIVSEIGLIVPLNRLDGVTFAMDYDAALRDLDRGFKANTPLTTTNEPNAVGMAMAPIVRRDGVAKAHIVARSSIGHGLITEDENIRTHCTYLFADRLVSAACTELFDVAIPGTYFTQIERQFDSIRYEIVAPSWTAYIGTRVCAPIFTEAREGYTELLLSALERAQKELPEIRLSYRFDGDLGKLMTAAISEVKRILQHAASLIGHADGLKETPFDGNGKLQAMLTRMNLRQWFDWYQRDLRKMYESRGEWKSFDEFLTLGDHAERLLIQYGMFLWERPDGNCGVAVPLISDAARLPKATLQRPHAFIAMMVRNAYAAIRQRFSRMVDNDV